MSRIETVHKLITHCR